jgi:hypothetical protein
MDITSLVRDGEDTKQLSVDREMISFDWAANAKNDASS